MRSEWLDVIFLTLPLIVSLKFWRCQLLFEFKIVLLFRKSFACNCKKDEGLSRYQSATGGKNRMIGSALRGYTGIRIRRGAVAGSRRLENYKFFSSSAGKKEPKLSNRNKRDLFILALGICGAFGYHSLYRNSDWDRDVHVVRTKLIASSAGQKRRRNENTNATIANNIKLAPSQDSAFANSSPPAILRFIEKVLKQPNPSRENHSKDVVQQHPSWTIARAKQTENFTHPSNGTLLMRL